MLTCMHERAIYKAPWLDPRIGRIGIYTSCSYRQGESGWAKVTGEEKSLHIYNKQKWYGYVYGGSRGETLLWT